GAITIGWFFTHSVSPVDFTGPYAPIRRRERLTRGDRARLRAHAKRPDAWAVHSGGTGAPGSLWGVFNGDARGNVESILESRLPVAIGTTDTVFLIPLTLGARSDWCRNVLAGRRMRN